MNYVKKVKYLKIDTEGHDCIILNSLYDNYNTLNYKKMNNIYFYLKNKYLVYINLLQYYYQ